MGRIGNSINFSIIVLSVFVYTHLSKASALDIKCAASEKTSVISSLNQQRAMLPPAQQAKVDVCIQSVNAAFNSCLNTLNSGSAAAMGAGATQQAGQLQNFQNQQNFANNASQLSMHDKAINDACVQQASSTQGQCTGFLAASAAQSYASKVQANCAMDAQQAAENSKSLGQAEEAAKELTPQQPSPNAGTPANTPTSPTTNPTSGYTPTATTPTTNPSNLNLPNPLSNFGANKNLASNSTPPEVSDDKNKKIGAGYAVPVKEYEFLLEKEKELALKARHPSGSASTTSPNNNLLAASDSGYENQGNNSSTANESTNDLSASSTTNPSMGGGLAFAPLSNSFGTSGGLDMRSLVDKLHNPNTPLVEKTIDMSELPSKSKYGARAQIKSPEKRTLLGSLLKDKKANSRRVPNSDANNTPIPDTEDQSQNRSLALLALVALTSAAGGIYKKYLSA